MERIRVTPSKYIQIPQEVEAIQWDGGVESARDIVDWISSCNRTARHFLGTGNILIDIPGGVMNARIGDFVVKVDTGNFYPVSPENFLKAHTPASDGQTVMPQTSTRGNIRFIEVTEENRFAIREAARILTWRNELRGINHARPTLAWDSAIDTAISKKQYFVHFLPPAGEDGAEWYSFVSFKWLRENYTFESLQDRYGWFEATSK